MNPTLQHDIRFDWGLQGARRIADAGGVAIVVDVLSFSTTVDIACSRGAWVYPYRFRDASAEGFALAHGALVAASRGAKGFSLSPHSVLAIEPGTKLVLPSPNGATLSLACGAETVFAGCLRNASAVAEAAVRAGGPIAVLAAAEEWPDGSPRFALEDLLGAGAILRALAGSKSPEAKAAEATFVDARASLASTLRSCVSGRELLERGFPADVELAAQLDVSLCVPLLTGGAFIRAEG